MNTPSTVFKTASGALPPGTRLAEFEITGVIGEGGFGIVYSANDSSLERIVAIKEYLPSAFSQRVNDGTVQAKSEEHQQTFAAGLASFIKEARMLAKFSHPGLVEVFRFWEGNGTAYMAMRYYRGVTLREVLRTSRPMVTEQWLCETLDPILLALKELHGERCFHRDIAPDNILVLPNGRSVLMDFGAARRIISGMTQALTTVLKPGYAPIEQYYDDGSMPQGAWTDIYAIGGLLYHAMTDKVPLQAISRMISDPLKPPGEIAVGVFSERLSAVVMKCMAVMPENRYQTVDELRTALGWVTTPVVSTVVHRPLSPPLAQVDDMATVIMSVSAQREALLAAGLGATGQAVSRLGPVIEQDSEATVIMTRPPKNVAPVTAPAPAPTSVPNSHQQAQVKPVPVMKKPADQPARKAVEPSTPKPKASVNPLLVGGAVIVLMLVVGGLYFFLSPKSPDVYVVPLASPPVEVSPAVQPSLPAVLPSSASLDAVAPLEVASAPVAIPAVAPAVVSIAPPPVAAAPKPVVITGTVRVELSGGWGTVFVNGEEKGTVPPVLSFALAPGVHVIEIRNPAVPTEKRSVKVVAGKTVLLRHAFSK